MCVAWLWHGVFQTGGVAVWRRPDCILVWRGSHYGIDFAVFRRRWGMRIADILGCSDASIVVVCSTRVTVIPDRIIW